VEQKYHTDSYITFQADEVLLCNALLVIRSLCRAGARRSQRTCASCEEGIKKARNVVSLQAFRVCVGGR